MHPVKGRYRTAPQAENVLRRCLLFFVFARTQQNNFFKVLMLTFIYAYDRMSLLEMYGKNNRYIFECLVPKGSKVSTVTPQVTTIGFRQLKKGVAKRARETDRSVSLFFCMLSPVQKLADRISKVFLEDEKL